MTVKTRWYCEECDDVCEKRPSFNRYLPNRKNAINFFDTTTPGSQILCTTCKHPANKHTFTFKTPKAEVA